MSWVVQATSRGCVARSIADLLLPGDDRSSPPQRVRLIVHLARLYPADDRTAVADSAARVRIAAGEALGDAKLPDALMPLELVLM